MAKKDNMALGILIGIILPGLVFGLLSLILFFIGTGPAWARSIEFNRLILVSAFINLIPIRIYFVNWKLDKTGRGVLLVTFVLMVLYFAFIRYL